MTLNSKRLRMRAPEPSDLDFLYLLENSDGAEGCGFTAAPVSRRMLHDYIEAYSADINTDGQLRLVIEDTATGQAIGTADISDYDSRDRRGFVGIIITDSHRRQGYGTEALQLLCNYAATTLGMHQLAAIIEIDNEASKALFTACGFRPAGRLRSWLRRGRNYADALLFQRLFP